MSKPLRFALMGCGRISRKHIESLKNLDGAVIAAVCDTDRERAESAAASAGKVPFYQDCSKMLSETKADVLSILTPSGMHARHTIAAAEEFGVHVVVEKPMALNLSDADRMIQTCAERNVQLFVVKQNRYNVPVMKLKEALENGRFGKLVMGSVRVRWTRGQEYYDQDEWRGTWAMDGGVFSNQASHHVDLLQWVLGDPVSVTAQTATRLAQVEVEDTGAALVRFKNGALGVIEATTAVRPVDLEGSLSLLGERGSVVIGGFAVNKMDTWKFSDSNVDEERRVLSEFSEKPDNVYGFGHQRYYREVVKSLRSGTHSPTDGAEGRKSLKLIRAIYRAAQTGSEVDFSRFTDD